MTNNDTPKQSEHITPNPTEEIAALQDAMSPVNQDLDKRFQLAHEARMAALQGSTPQAHETIAPIEQPPQSPDDQPISGSSTTTSSQ